MFSSKERLEKKKRKLEEELKQKEIFQAAPLSKKLVLLIKRHKFLSFFLCLGFLGFIIGDKPPSKPVVNNNPNSASISKIPDSKEARAHSTPSVASSIENEQKLALSKLIGGEIEPIKGLMFKQFIEAERVLACDFLAGPSDMTWFVAVFPRPMEFKIAKHIVESDVNYVHTIKYEAQGPSLINKQSNFVTFSGNIGRLPHRFELPDFHTGSVTEQSYSFSNTKWVISTRFDNRFVIDRHTQMVDRYSDVTKPDGTKDRGLSMAQSNAYRCRLLDAANIKGLLDSLASFIANSEYEKYQRKSNEFNMKRGNQKL